MNILKKILFMVTFITSIFLIGCSSITTKNQLPESKPKDFNFVFNYGVNAKNQLDTTKEQFTKDMVSEPSVTTNLKLSDDEMNTIYSEMKNINILGYADNFEPKSNKKQTPFSTYSLKIIVEGKEKNIYWKDESVSETKEAERLRKLFNEIEKIIVNKDEFKKLPEPTSHYQ